MKNTTDSSIARIVLLSATTCAAVAMVPSAAHSAPKSARRTMGFVHSIGVNVKWDKTKTPYVTQFPAVKQKLVDLGIRHVRSGRSNADIVEKMKALAASGIKTNFLLDPNSGVAPNSSFWRKSNIPYVVPYDINDFVKNIVGTNVIEAVEILNEIDDPTYGYTNQSWYPSDQPGSDATRKKLDNVPTSGRYWPNYTRAVMEATWNALKNDPETSGTTVIGPSFIDGNSSAKVGDISAWLNWGNMHSYPGGKKPTEALDSNITKARLVSGSSQPIKPVSATETGYHNALKAPNTQQQGVSEKAAAKYLLRLYFEYWNRPVPRTYIHQFMDLGTDDTNKEWSWGLLRYDLSEKPAYRALKSMIGVLREADINFSPTSLDYTLGGDTTNVRSSLLQKSDGSFYIALWQDVSSYEPTTETDLDAAPRAVTLSFATPLDSEATLYSFTDNGDLISNAKTISGGAITFNVVDKVTILRVSPPGAARLAPAPIPTSAPSSASTTPSSATS